MKRWHMWFLSQNRRSAPDRFDSTDHEHQALHQLYEDADETSGWRMSLLAFTASHLQRHRLSGPERRAIREALDAGSAPALTQLEQIHAIAHGGVNDIVEIGHLRRR